MKKVPIAEALEQLLDAHLFQNNGTASGCTPASPMIVVDPTGMRFRWISRFIGPGYCVSPSGLQCSGLNCNSSHVMKHYVGFNLSASVTCAMVKACRSGPAGVRTSWPALNLLGCEGGGGGKRKTSNSGFTAIDHWACRRGCSGTLQSIDRFG